MIGIIGIDTAPFSLLYSYIVAVSQWLPSAPFTRFELMGHGQSTRSWHDGLSDSSCICNLLVLISR